MTDRRRSAPARPAGSEAAETAPATSGGAPAGAPPAGAPPAAAAPAAGDSPAGAAPAVGAPPAGGAAEPASIARAGQPVPRWAAWYLGLGRRGRLLLAGATVALAVVAGFALAGTGGGSGRSAPPPLAKNFTIPVLGHPGQRLSLSAYQGKPLILNFFASWCHPCQQETPLLARFYRSHHGQVQIIGIAVNDPVQPALAFVRKTGVSYPVGTDSPPNTATAYDVSGLPQTFFLNTQHRIVKRVLGAVTAQQLSAGTALIEPRAT